jgi:hypothetical protein
MHLPEMISNRFNLLEKDLSALAYVSTDCGQQI